MVTKMCVAELVKSEQILNIFNLKPTGFVHRLIQRLEEKKRQERDFKVSQYDKKNIDDTGTKQRESSDRENKIEQKT